MARPRLSADTTIEQVLDFLTDCSKTDLLYAAVAVARRRDSLRVQLENQRDGLNASIELLKQFDLSAVQLPPVQP